MTATVIATTIATFAAAVSPILLRYVKLDGLQMAALSYVVATGIAVAAEFIAGQWTTSQQAIIAILSGSAAFWTVQQAVYHVLHEANPAIVNPPTSTRTA